MSRSSVGVQVTPPYVSVSVQAQPAKAQISVQTHANCVSTSTQIDPPPHSSSATQTEDNHRYMSLDIQTDTISEEANSYSFPLPKVCPPVIPITAGFYLLLGIVEKPVPHGPWQYALFAARIPFTTAILFAGNISLSIVNCRPAPCWSICVSPLADITGHADVAR